MPITRLNNNSIKGTTHGINFRNIIINGGMDIAQRGISVTGTTDGYKTCDRWNFKRSVGTIDLAQSTDVPTGEGFAKSFKVAVTTGATPSANDRQYIEQHIEGQNLQYLKKGTSSAKSLTVSFHIKSDVTGTYIVELEDTDNTRNFSQSYTISSADTWEKKTLTFVGDTSGAFTNDAAKSLTLRFYLSAGTTYTSGTLNTSWNSVTNANTAVGQVNFPATTNNELYLTGVQLEASDTASEFEFLPFDINLSRCNRYFTTSQAVSKFGEFATGDENAIFAGRIGPYGNQPLHVRFPVRMRSEPTVTLYSLTGLAGYVSNTTTTAGTHGSNDGVNPTKVSQSGIGYLTGFGGSDGQGLAFQYEADAEM